MAYGAKRYSEFGDWEYGVAVRDSGFVGLLAPAAPREGDDARPTGERVEAATRRFWSQLFHRAKFLGKKLIASTPQIT